MRKAFVVGINDYKHNVLSGCVNDANVVAELLGNHANGDPNFDVKKLLDVGHKYEVYENIKWVFDENEDVETALFYFAGHGMFDSDKGYLVFPDVYETHDGLAMQDVLDLANKSKARNKIIILDCCHSGAITVSASSVVKPYVARGVTVLAATREFESAAETREGGLFTTLFCEALRGGASGICGTVTPGSIYAFIDRSLGPWCQRPVFISHVTSFVSMRNCVPKVPLDILRELPKFFPTDAFEYKLDPSFEDTNNPEAIHHVIEPHANAEKVAIFKMLQKLQSVGIVMPVNEDYMYFAAMNSKSCKLTALGVHYMHLARDGRI